MNGNPLKSTSTAVACVPPAAIGATRPGTCATDNPDDVSLITVRDVRLAFDISAPWMDRLIQRRPRQFLAAVDDVSFDIRRGETLALVGESGCGKSTLARLLVGLYRADRGSVRFDDHPLQELPLRERRRIQMIFQDPYASLNPRWRVSSIIAEPIRVHGLLKDRAEIAARVASLLEQVGLSTADAEKFPHQFSGGQRQRISIARALAAEPEFLVCDEPTSALDVSVQAQVLNLMRDLQIARGLTYLFISHNLAVVHHVSDRVGVMYLGRIVELGSRADVFERPLHPYTRMLLNAIPGLDGSRLAGRESRGEVATDVERTGGCGYAGRCGYAQARCRTERPEVRRYEGREVACHLVETLNAQSSSSIER